MKNIIFLMLLAASILSCGKEQATNELASKNTSTFQDPVVLGHSMKGWELYSWSEGTNWKFSILSGTNRGKYLNEVLTGKYKVTGVDSLKVLLNQLPTDEFISWRDKVGQDATGVITIHDAATVNDVKSYCQSRKLNLFVPNF